MCLGSRWDSLVGLTFRFKQAMVSNHGTIRQCRLMKTGHVRSLIRRKGLVWAVDAGDGFVIRVDGYDVMGYGRGKEWRRMHVSCGAAGQKRAAFILRWYTEVAKTCGRSQWCLPREQRIVESPFRGCC